MGRRRKNWHRKVPMTCVNCGGGSSFTIAPASGVLGTSLEKARVDANVCKRCWNKMKKEIGEQELIRIWISRRN
jgi:formate dehydrogenase maturation protein FdhE